MIRLSQLKENKEDAEGNENIAGQGEDIGRSDNDGAGDNVQSTGSGLRLSLDTDSDHGIEIGAHLPMNQPRPTGQIGSLVQSDTNNVGGQSIVSDHADGIDNGQGNGNGNDQHEDDHVSGVDGAPNGQHDGDDDDHRHDVDQVSNGHNGND